MEFNIQNLKFMYDKALKENSEINYFFNIRTPSDAELILTPPINRRVKKHELRIIFEELCYTSKFHYNDVFSYLDMMKKRISDIENVIDHHLELIKQSVYQSKLDKIERENKKNASMDKEAMKNKPGKKKKSTLNTEEIE